MKRAMDNSGGTVKNYIRIKYNLSYFSSFLKQKNTYIVDGFPRNKENLDGFLEVFGDLCKVICVLFLDCPVEKCSDRISIRSQSSGRIDDNSNSLKKRFCTFEAETLPNIKYLEEITKIVRVESGKDSIAVFNDICEKLDGLLDSF